jgi:OOP family OmpA-OmpF porin
MASCALLCPQAQADDDWSHEEWANSAWYLGAGAGASKAKLDEGFIRNTLSAAGATSVLVNSDQRDTGYKLFMGKQFSRHMALEAGWFDLGRFGFDATTVPAASFSGRDRVRGWNLDMLFLAPMSQQVSVYGRLGAAYARSNSEFGGTRIGLIPDPDGSDRKFSPKVGLGLEYKFSEALAMRGEVERYRINSNVRNRRDIDLYSLNLVYKFGRPALRSQASIAPAAMPISETRPAPVEMARAAEPAPAPVPAARPVPVSEKVTFAAEALFDFDKSVVKPDGQAALDDLLLKLQGMNTEVMVTVGHTDSVGTDDYNQKLSLRRAEAVKAYLMSKGIESTRVFTDGKGEADPIVDNKSAENRSKNRRVTVEVVGTRTVSR